jgi:hypothetical protein
MLVPDVTEPVPAAFELTLHVTVFTGLLCPKTDAVYCRLLPAATDWFAGLTFTLVTVGISTVTGTMPDFEISTVDVATTKSVCKVSCGAIVRMPAEFMLVPDVTAPVPAGFELTLHVTVVAGSFVPVTKALNCRLLPAATD